MYINDLVKARTLPSQMLAKQRARRTPLRVGTDVMKMAEHKTQTLQPKDVAFAGSSAAGEKFGDHGPASYSVTKGNVTVTVGYHEDKDTKEVSLMATISDGSGKKPQLVKVTEDMRISQGANGNLQILTGKDALSGGKLAGSDGDILVRVSGADVKVDRGDVGVINFSKGGTFDGGAGKVHYAGEYYQATFTGGSAGNTFGTAIDPNSVQTGARGVFDQCTVNAGDGNNEYAGYFIGSHVEGGAGKDVFNGIFADDNTLNGNDGDDSFTGFFKNSDLSGGRGENSFTYVNQSGIEAGLASFEDASLQFLNVNIDAGEASIIHGVFEGATITLNSGSHNLSGAFLNSTVNNQQSEDTSINAFYAFGTKFIGENGSTKLTVHSGEHFTVDLGEGDNDVALGAQKNNTVFKFLGGQVDLPTTRFYRNGKEKGIDCAGTGYGTIDGVRIKATEGSTTLDINTGLERTVQHFDGSGENTDASELLIQKPAATGDEKAELVAGPAQAEETAEGAEGKDIIQTGKESVAEPMNSVDIPEFSYEYLGLKKRRSRGVVTDPGIDEAVEIKTSHGVQRYYQERNERLRHTKELGLFTTRYDWQI